MCSVTRLTGVKNIYIYIHTRKLRNNRRGRENERELLFLREEIVSKIKVKKNRRERGWPKKKGV